MKKEKIFNFVIVPFVVAVALHGTYLYGSNQNKNLHVNTTNQKVVDIFDSSKANNPFEEMQRMQQNMVKMFNSMNSQFSVMPEFKKYFSRTTISPSVNIRKFKDRYELEVNIPGSTKNSINVNAKNGILKIEAKTESKKDENSSNFIKREMFSGSFYRELSLPKDAIADKLKVSYKNGLLKIIIPRKG